MRTQRRGISITAAPPEWHLHCRQSLVVVTPEILTSDRSWWREYIELLEEGFVHCPGAGAERRRGQGAGLQVRAADVSEGFRAIGDEGELIARRTYALCVTCGEWAEF